MKKGENLLFHKRIAKASQHRDKSWLFALFRENDVSIEIDKINTLG